MDSEASRKTHDSIIAIMEDLQDHERRPSALPADRVEMKRLGKKQELRRNFNLVSIFSFMCVKMSTWVFVVMGSFSALRAAGTGGYIAVYGATCIVYLPFVLSFAEMASIAPTAGGQYHWTSEFAHPRAQRIMSHTAGWLLTVSWFCSTAFKMFLSGSTIARCINIMYPWTYSETRRGTYIRFIPVILISVAGMALNTVGAGHLALVEVTVAAFFVLGFATNLIVLWIMAPLNPAKEVFGSFTNIPNWPNIATTMLLAQNTILWLVSGSDGAAHMAEDTQDASLNVPRGILGSYLISAISGFVMVITYCFCHRPDPDLVSFTSFPFMEIYARATGSNSGTVGLTAIVTILSFFSGTNAMASASRQTFAFARDGGLPFHKALSKVSPKFHVPIMAVFVVFFSSLLLVALAKLDHMAYQTLMALQSLAYIAVFEIAVGTLIFRRLWGPPLPERRWSLGRAGLPINVFAFAYGLFAAGIMAMPTDDFKGHCPPHGCLVRNWNWGTVIFVGIMLIGMGYYLLGGRKHYAGPVTLVSDEGGWKPVRPLHVRHSPPTAG
ncbi:amino acid transporter [Teratosphaeria nubilosa]|uniref:Amino acid transporter n=1 Tax=Teratosphaeria nubilosa TaxID=161662 RepID=A0A6G1L1U4_9PEZI|nr:amino acid transporter [Teratosphaeria nubilosa]